MTEKDKALLGGLVALAIAASAISPGAEGTRTAGLDRIADVALLTRCISLPFCQRTRT